MDEFIYSGPGGVFANLKKLVIKGKMADVQKVLDLIAYYVRIEDAKDSRCHYQFSEN